MHKNMKFLNKHYLSLEKCLNWYIAKYKNSLLSEWFMCDWQDSVLKAGKTLYTNILYWKALSDFSQLSALANKSDSQYFSNQALAIKKAQDFYDRILDGYGDDSIGELGGAHLACEQVSIIASKVLEDPRIGGSPLEKSTRYIFFDNKVGGEYLYYKEPRIMASKHKALYLETMEMLFDTYTEFIEPMKKYIVAKSVYPWIKVSSLMHLFSVLRSQWSV